MLIQAGSSMHVYIYSIFSKMPTSNIVSRETDETLQLSPPLAEKLKTSHCY